MIISKKCVFNLGLHNCSYIRVDGDHHNMYTEYQLGQHSTTYPVNSKLMSPHLYPFGNKIPELLHDCSLCHEHSTMWINSPFVKLMMWNKLSRADIRSFVTKRDFQWASVIFISYRMGKLGFKNLPFKTWAEDYKTRSDNLIIDGKMMWK